MYKYILRQYILRSSPMWPIFFAVNWFLFGSLDYDDNMASCVHVTEESTKWLS